MQGKVAACSGGAGDIIYSIPVMRALGVSTYYVKKNFYHPPHSNLYETIRRILQWQGFICQPTSGDYTWGVFDPALEYDYNIDDFRNQPQRNVMHIIKNMARQFGVHLPYWNTPWLKIEPVKAPRNLIHLTPRWRENSTVNWRVVRSQMQGPQAFIGFQYEWVDFCQKYGNIEWLPTNDIYEMAQLVAGCEHLYCNQSVALTLAQGLGIQYYLEVKPGKSNTLVYTSKENIL